MASQVATGPGMVLVVVSFSFCCERSDFEPGGVVGFALWSASCCKPGHDGWYETIGNLLVADSNCDDSFLPGPKLPFWSNMFAYALLDTFRNCGMTKFHIVRTDRPEERESGEGWVVRDSFSQTVPTPSGAGAPGPTLYEVDPKKMHFDEIAMAPFCAHDCLHMHWRWNKDTTAVSSLGWDGGMPFQKSGAPLVPENQDVWLRFRSDHALTYHVVAGAGLEPGHSITAMESTALFYWLARYRAELVDGVLTAVPRTTYGENGLDLARDL